MNNNINKVTKKRQTCRMRAPPKVLEINLIDDDERTETISNHSFQLLENNECTPKNSKKTRNQINECHALEKQTEIKYQTPKQSSFSILGKKFKRTRKFKKRLIYYPNINEISKRHIDFDNINIII